MIEIESMFPVMVVSDLEALSQFYQTVFGFVVVFFDADFYLHLVSPSTGAQLGFLVPEHSSQPEFLHALMSTDGYVISLEVKDAAAAFAQARELDLHMTMELKEEVWGQIHFMLQDPAGIKIDVVQQLASPE